MAMPSRAEMEAAFRRYLEVGAYGRDWNAWADLFSEDAVYVEAQYGTFHGREAMVERGRDVVMREFSAEAMVRHLEDVYARALSMR